MSWTAVVPLKAGAERKSRLAPVLDARKRAELGEAMADHVLGRLRACPAVADVLLLSPEPPRRCGVAWRRDGGGGLNAELTLLRVDLADADLLVVHADLPLLSTADVKALAEAGDRHGVALAPDRHGRGTNALALKAGHRLAFALGDDSFARHRAEAPHAAVVVRPGLQWDVDTPDDLAAVEARLSAASTGTARP